MSRFLSFFLGGIRGILCSLLLFLSVKKRLGICGPHRANVGAKWSILVGVGGAAGGWPSVNLTQTCPSKPGQPLKTNKSPTTALNLKFGSSFAVWSVSRTYILGPDTNYTYRINLSGVAPTSLPTFYLNFCLHWVKLSPRNCMDLHTRGWHGIYQMCRIMNRSLHFNRGNARDALARMGAGYTSLQCTTLPH